MTVPFMDAYVRLLIKTCHRRGVHAMGGMAAQIPIKSDPAANEAAMVKVCGAKGYDGGSEFRVCVWCLVGSEGLVFVDMVPQQQQQCNDCMSLVTVVCGMLLTDCVQSMLMISYSVHMCLHTRTFATQLVTYLLM